MNLEDALLRGLRASQPVAAAVGEGILYFVTDEDITEQSRGGAWVTYSGPAGSLTAIDGLTGDVTATGPGVVAATLANTAVTPGTYGDASNIPQLTVDGKGRITLATNIPVTIPSPGLNLLATATGVGGAGSVLDFNSVITSLYDEYEFHFQNVKPVTDNHIIALRFSSNNGVSFDTANNYCNGYLYANMNPAGPTLAGNNGLSFMPIAGSVGNGATMAGANGVLKLWNPLDTTMQRMLSGNFAFYANDAPKFYYSVWGGAYQVTTAINSVRFLTNTGLFTTGLILSGTIRCYGVKK